MKKFLQARRADGRAVVLAYGTILFSSNPWVGALLLAATLLAPALGLTGLAGTVVALVAARLAGFDRHAVADGRLLFNSMLCSLSLAHWLPPGTVSPVAYVVLLVIVAVAALAATVILNHITILLLGTPSLSLPFCVVSTGLHWFAGQQYRPLAAPMPWEAMDFVHLPPGLELWSHSLGSIFFAPGVTTGLLMTVALVLSSRLSVIYGVTGFLVSGLLLWSLHLPWEGTAWLQLNAILCAIAVGGVFYLPSRASLALAAVAAGLCAFAGVALTRFLHFVDAPPLTLPFNLVVLATIAALRWREAGRLPAPVVLGGRTPEEAFRIARLSAARYPDPGVPTLALPFDGEWVVTQGFDGGLTHRGAWRHALDFEVADERQKPARPDSAELLDFPSYEAPIVSPVDGRVVRVVDDITDNAVGETNLAENWGNGVVIEISPHLFVLLAHFRRKGLKVREGDRVRAGQLLGYLGNSGRSPLPHLHMQVQTSPEIGAPTIPFRLANFRLREGDHWGFQFQGLPVTNQCVGGARRTAWMEECFRREGLSAVHVFSPRGEELETVRQELDADGSVILRSVKRRAVLHLRPAGGVVYPIHFENAGDSVLRLPGICGRIPLTANAGLEWTETIEEPRRFWSDLVRPFFPRPLPQVRGRLVSCDARARRFTLRWTFADGASTELTFAADQGLLAGRSESRSGWLRFSLPADEESRAALTV